MTRKEIETLVDNKKWSLLLKCLDVGETTITFPDILAIKSFKTMAYDYNACRTTNNNYSLAIDKANLCVTIKTTPRNGI